MPRYAGDNYANAFSQSSRASVRARTAQWSLGSAQSLGAGRGARAGRGAKWSAALRCAPLTQPRMREREGGREGASEGGRELRARDGEREEEYSQF